MKIIHNEKEYNLDTGDFNIGDVVFVEKTEYEREDYCDIDGGFLGRIEGFGFYFDNEKIFLHKVFVGYYDDLFEKCIRDFDKYALRLYTDKEGKSILIDVNNCKHRKLKFLGKDEGYTCIFCNENFSKDIIKKLRGVNGKNNK